MLPLQRTSTPPRQLSAMDHHYFHRAADPTERRDNSLNANDPNARGKPGRRTAAAIRRSLNRGKAPSKSAKRR